MESIEILNEKYESLVVYDELTKKELVRITKSNIEISSSSLQVRLKPAQD